VAPAVRFPVWLYIAGSIHEEGSTGLFALLLR
jgi:hypothetical protein